MCELCRVVGQALAALAAPPMCQYGRRVRLHPHDAPCANPAAVQSVFGIYGRREPHIPTGVATVELCDAHLADITRALPGQLTKPIEWFEERR